MRDFPTVRAAAEFIQTLVDNGERYLEYHRWRNEKEVRSSFVKMVNYFEEANKHSIECLLCDMVYRNDHGTIRRKLLVANNPFSDTFPSLIQRFFSPLPKERKKKARLAVINTSMQMVDH